MEPSKTHSATLPQQDLTRPAGGCLPELRSADLLRGGHEGANPHVGQRAANDDVVDRATAGTSHALGVTASLLGAENDNDKDHTGLASVSTFTRLDALQFLAAESKKINGPLARPSDLRTAERRCLIKLALRGALHSTLSVPQQIELDHSISSFISKIEKKYKDCRSNMPFFRKKHKDWLSKMFVCDIPKDLIKSEVGSTLSTELQDVQPRPDGSRELDSAPELEDVVTPGCSRDAKYEQLSSRQQLRLRKKLQSVLQDEPPKKLIKVFTETIAVGAHLSKKAARDLEDIINECLTSPNRATEIKAKLGHEVKSRQKKTTQDDNTEDAESRKQT